MQDQEPEDLSAIVNALLCWAQDTQTPPLDKNCMSIFKLMTKQIERISEVNSTNGRLGGRPKSEKSETENLKPKKANESEKSERKRKKPSVTDTITNTKTVTDTETVTKPITEGKQKKRARAGAFTPPTADEVWAYCQKRQNCINPDGFVDFYASKGWFVGKNKMVDWQASVRTWEKRARASPTFAASKYCLMPPMYQGMPINTKEARNRARLDAVFGPEPKIINGGEIYAADGIKEIHYDADG